MLPDQDGATPAVLASKKGHGDLAALIASGGNAPVHNRPAASATAMHLAPLYHSSEQLQVCNPATVC